MCQTFYTAGQDLKPGALSRESKALPLNHSATTIWDIDKYTVYYVVDFYYKY